MKLEQKGREGQPRGRPLTRGIEIGRQRRKTFLEAGLQGKIPEKRGPSFDFKEVRKIRPAT